MNQNVRQVVPAYLTLFLWNITWSISITGPVLPLYIESLGVDIVGWSALAATFAVGSFLTEWVWGSLCDRTDRRYLMILSVLSMSVLFALYSNHGLVRFFIVLQLLSGALGVIIGPTTRAYISDVSPKKSIGLFASVWWAFHTLGRTVGPLIGAYIAQTWSFEYSFYASSAMSILLMFLILLSFPSDKKRLKSENLPSILRGLKSVLRMRSARLLFLSALFSFMGISLIRSFLPLYASEQIRMSTVEVGMLIASVWGAQLVAMPLLGWLSDKFGRFRTAIVGFILSAGIFLLYFFAGTASQLFAVSIAIGVALSVSTLLLAMIPSVAPNTMYGTVVGVYGSFEDLGVIIGPVVFGFVWSAYGAVFVFAASAITQLFCGCLIFVVAQKLNCTNKHSE